jgi:hypothetical protein
MWQSTYLDAGLIEYNGSMGSTFTMDGDEPVPLNSHHHGLSAIPIRSKLLRSARQSGV